MTAFLDTIQSWLATLPIGALYALLGILAFIEGLFPLIPADIVVAFGSFLAAQRGASYVATASSIVVGSVAGAMVAYSVARRYGAAWLHERLKRAGIDNLEQRLELMYSKYGMTALFVSRFIPGLRMITPPMAGAARIPPIRTALVFLLASSIWYGAISWIAFTLGDDWATLQRAIGRFVRQVGVVAAVSAGLIVGIAIIVMRRRAAAKIAAALQRADSGTK